MPASGCNGQKKETLDLFGGYDRSSTGGSDYGGAMNQAGLNNLMKIKVANDMSDCLPGVMDESHILTGHVCVMSCGEHQESREHYVSAKTCQHTRRPCLMKR